MRASFSVLLTHVRVHIFFKGMQYASKRILISYSKNLRIKLNISYLLKLVKPSHGCGVACRLVSRGARPPPSFEPLRRAPRLHC